MVVSLSDRLYAISSMIGIAKLRPGKAVWLNLPKRCLREFPVARAAICRTPALLDLPFFSLRHHQQDGVPVAAVAADARCRDARRAARDSVVRARRAPGATPRGGRARPSWRAPRRPRAGRVLPARQALGVRGFASRSSSWSYRVLCVCLSGCECVMGCLYAAFGAVLICF